MGRSKRARRAIQLRRLIKQLHSGGELFRAFSNQTPHPGHLQLPSEMEGEIKAQTIKSAK